jgi:long-chain acyl-CoA synthetase
MIGTLAQFLKWEKETPDKVCFRQPINGQYKTWTYREAGIEVRKICAGFKAQGLPEGSHIAIISKNCAEWIMVDLAIMMGGYVSIPIYPTLTAQSIEPILVHSETKLVFVGKLDDYNSQKDGIPADIIRLSASVYGIDEANTWEKWLSEYDPVDSAYDWKPDQVVTIMYTSGTTGKPKGVMHTVEAFHISITTAIRDLGLDQIKDPRMFSYLPLSHIAERIGIETAGMYLGATFSFAESLDTFGQNLAETNPTLFFAVPRIWSKFREKIEEKLPPKKLNTLLSIPLIGGLIKKSIKKKLGLSKAKHIFSGAAPISVEMLQWYQKLGIEILQAYGMTEDCIYAHFNRNGNNKHGSVGLPFKGLSVKISDEGEIRVKCPGLTKGYFKEPEMTAALFDEEGYLKTGDKGEIDKDGFLYITGRIKDLFKTDKGKYIAPAPIEMLVSTSPDVESVCVVGMGVPQPIALVVLSAAGLAKSKDEIVESLGATLDEVNSGLEAFEQLKKVVVMKNAWTVENDLMTPTLKVKRNEVEKLHMASYPQWYNMSGKVIWE